MYECIQFTQKFFPFIIMSDSYYQYIMFVLWSHICFILSNFCSFPFSFFLIIIMYLYSLFGSPWYGWKIAKVGFKHQSINQFSIWKRSNLEPCSLLMLFFPINWLLVSSIFLVSSHELKSNYYTYMNERCIFYYQWLEIFIGCHLRNIVGQTLFQSFSPWNI